MKIEITLKKVVAIKYTNKYAHHTIKMTLYFVDNIAVKYDSHLQNFAYYIWRRHRTTMCIPLACFMQSSNNITLTGDLPTRRQNCEVKEIHS